ncbi:MAG: sigma 54-interacting transcriptional regulator [Desulfomonilaceae bacterium]|nr:sigma 54-interacting transcriptional regulator [Desulfomonilaceae bacterium]
MSTGRDSTSATDAGHEPMTGEEVSAYRQALKYAEDMSKLFGEEKAKRKELEEANQRLLAEIAERKRAETELRRSEERLKAIFETAQDCVYMKDRDIRYTHVNPAMANLLQMPVSEILGKTDESLYGLDAARHLRHSDLRVLQGETIEEEHTRLIRGAPTTFLETKAPLHDQSGDIVGICGMARNITDRARRKLPTDEPPMEYPSRPMKETLTKAKLVALQDSIVLLLGESGSGKDFMARYIHDNSPRSSGPFFTVNCASVAPELAESELFGHEQGAFTGARARKRGLLELAEGGTLFLNEIGELSPRLQAKLLTFLDTRSFARVGAERNITVNARLIVATNRDLEKEVSEGRFRSDLFHRINVLSIRVPALRERTVDIPVLVGQITRQLEKDLQLVSKPVFDEEVMERLKTYHWPGNVRELRNMLERALILSGGGRIPVASLGLDQARTEWSYFTDFPHGRSLNDVTRDLKRALVSEALRRCGGSPTRAADLLGISRNSLNHYMKSLGVRE